MPFAAKSVDFYFNLFGHGGGKRISQLLCQQEIVFLLTCLQRIAGRLVPDQSHSLQYVTGALVF